ncbi:MAG: DUF1800 family protein [Alphaproteobacteria bacterium]|nr:DUF1800 family protein [Alphaproteobacteria bacterium]
MTILRWCQESQAVAAIVAVGVNADGRRKVLGLEIALRKPTPSGRFLRKLARRCLRGVKLHSTNPIERMSAGHVPTSEMTNSDLPFPLHQSMGADQSRSFPVAQPLDWGAFGMRIADGFRAFLIGFTVGTLCVLAASPARALGIEEARHLLARAGFGAAPTEIAALLPLTRPQAVDKLIGETRVRPVVTPPAWTGDPKPQYWGQEKWSRDEKEAFRMAREAEIRQLKAWWFTEMIATPSPLTERMVMFWHNHFTSSFESIGNWSHMMYDQQVLFREKGLATFGALLDGILRDPAMLRYLDNHSNRKGKPNENLARELLELFTLGEGHYGERDIKEVARALSGWAIDMKKNYAFVAVASQHDDGVKTIFGQKGNFDGKDVARILLEQPRTAEFVVEKLWREFVSDAPARAEVVRLANGFRESDYQIKPLLREILLGRDFWAPENRATQIKSPVDLLVGTVRTFVLPVSDVNALPAVAKRLGQDVFVPPNVKGWIGGTTWINPAWLLLRYQTVDRLMSAREIDAASMIQMASAGPRQAMLRAFVGGEACRGAPRMLVAVNGLKVAEVSVDYAHDTERLGRIPDSNEVEKRVIEIPLPAAVSEVRVIKIDFPNDHGISGKDGYAYCDRNLFVDWIEIGDKRYATEAGTQTHVCSRPPRPGRLYCNGTLTMEIAELDQKTGVEGGMAMMAALATVTDAGMRAMMIPPRDNVDVVQALRMRRTLASLDDWAKPLPLEARTVEALWRALTPIPPMVSPAPGEDAETALRRIAGDLAYQLR